MPLDNRELSTELHRVQTKLNIAETRIEELLVNEKMKGDSERLTDRIIGLTFISGVLIMNFIAPKLIGSFLSNNFSPKIGPVDVVGILIGIAFLWKGIKK